MIFDDHEITDDWNLNLAWEKRVYDTAPPASRPTALGRAIIRNGLAAYAVFQAWGNTPEQFARGHAGGAGHQAARCAGQVGRHGRHGSDAPGHRHLDLRRHPGRLRRPQVVEARRRADLVLLAPLGSARGVVLDTRTERGAADPVEPEAPPALIYDGAMIDTMARPASALADADTLVIAIAPGPVFGVPLHEATARYIHLPSIPVISPRVKANPGMDPEHWALTPFARERLLSALMSRPRQGRRRIHPPPRGPARRRRPPRLGGASALPRDGAAACRDGGPAVGVEGVIAQLTSSALKNEDVHDTPHRDARLHHDEPGRRC